MKLFFFFCFFLFSLNSAFSQTYRFNQYTTENGVAQNFIYSISQDSKGYLWIGTGEGLSRFNGKHFDSFTTLDGLAENIITCSHVDSKGIQWFGHNEGGITKFINGEFTSIKTKGLNESKINAISSIDGKVYFVSQNNGLFEIINETVVQIGTFRFDNFFTIQCLNKSNLVFGTDEGLIHVTKEGKQWNKKGHYLTDQWITSINNANEDEVYLVGTKSDGITRFKLKEQKLQFSKWDGSNDLSVYSIQTILQDKDDNLWLGTSGQGLIKLHTDSTGAANNEMTIYNTSSGLSSNFVQSAFQDREGNIWIGTFGAGISTLIDDFFTFYSHDDDAEYSNNVTAIWAEDSIKWYGVENGLLKISPFSESKWQFYNGDNGFVNDRVTSLYKTKSSLWIGTSNSGVYRLDLTTEKMEKIEWDYGSLQNKINQLTVKSGTIWVATEGGLIVYNIKNKSTNLFDTSLGLAHNSVKSVCLASDGRVWMGTQSRYIYSIFNSSIEEYEITSTGELEVISITEDIAGKIWFATAENGAYKKVGKNFINFRVEDGLKSNYCYAIHSDAAGNMWIGHRGGLSKISLDTENIIFFDHKSGIEDQVNFNAIFLDSKSYLWIGTEGGAIKYDPEKDKENNIAPVINLLKVIINENEYDPNQPIVLPYGDYRISFEFIGISFKNSDKVKYKFKLDGYDNIFSNPTGDPVATYGRINDGQFTFKVIACTDDNVCSEMPATISISISKPFWKTWWFYLLVIIAISGATYLFVQARIKRFKAAQIYLEEQLEIKTKEVVEKADRIEEINKDLTASINYAKRIQTAILPLEDGLNKHFPNSFIFFQPRDVVSGDFYFIRQFERKLIVACCDCTGHGVPGAFMSMIGSTTLRNIYKLMENSGNWRSPEKVLELLDLEIQKILHQGTYTADLEEDYFKSRDGMDLTLCEIDLDSNLVSMSAAKRHSFIKRNGELNIFTGDKRGIGGGEVDEIDFTLSKFQMHKGDILYLFTDGYPDQFGGPDGRKLKISGTQNLINQLEDLDPAKEYAKHISSKFNGWKGDLDQIDDVLFMGILF